MKPHLRFRKQSAHIRGCFAMRHYRSGFWPTPWGCLAFSPLGGRSKLKSVEPTYRQKRGPASGTWLRFVCNNPQCGAHLLVREEDVLVMASACGY